MSAPSLNLAQTVAALVQQMNGVGNSMSQMVTTWNATVWNNSFGTPYQVVQGMGFNAAGLFLAMEHICLAVGYLTGNTPSYIPSGYSYTTNSNGTINLT
jgi:hypothetical protein